MKKGGVWGKWEPKASRFLWSTIESLKGFDLDISDACVESGIFASIGKH